jgi:hypothetical protein
MSKAVAGIETKLSPITALYTRLLSRKENIGLLEYLLISRNRKATDHKDHVYGILGLADLRTLVPNYRNSVSAVFTETARQLIATTGSRDVLSACGHPELRHYSSYVELIYASMILQTQTGVDAAKDFLTKPTDQYFTLTMTPYLHGYRIGVSHVSHCAISCYEVENDVFSELREPPVRRSGQLEINQKGGQ